MPGLRCILSAIFAMLLAVGAAAGEEQDRGKLEYVNSCQVCHGAEGKGDGPFKDVMSLPIPDLTTIRHRNGGKFPIDEILRVIDGREPIEGHGFPMPVWGNRYKADAAEEAGFWEVPAELLARSRILELTFYLLSIQE